MAIFGSKGGHGLLLFRIALGPCVGLQAFPTTLAAEPAFAHAAKSGSRVKHVRAVDPDHTGDQFRRDIQCQIDVLAPDCGGQPVAGVVGHLDSLGRGAECCANQHGTKDFFLHQGISRR